MMSCADSRLRVAFRKRDPFPSWAEPAWAYEPNSCEATAGSSDCRVASAGTTCVGYRSAVNSARLCRS